MQREQERCWWCCRFMKHEWFLATDEPDSWQDYWVCSQEAKHRAEHPEFYSW